VSEQVAHPFVRPPGSGWLALLGGGEFTFGETLDADRAWLDKAPPGRIGFLPAASGSLDYPQHFAVYLRETFDRELETLPIYRSRDGRRGRNAERLAEMAAVYVGGGAPEQLLDAVAGTPVDEALRARLAAGGVVATIAASAQCLGAVARTLTGGGKPVPGLGWLVGGVVEPNFDPEHDRRLRQLLRQPGVAWGVGIPTGAALLLGPEGAFEVVDSVYVLETPEGDYTLLEEEEGGGDELM
jgi:cyanophycinase-like exopeptidase